MRNYIYGGLCVNKDFLVQHLDSGTDGPDNIQIYARTFIYLFCPVNILLQVRHSSLFRHWLDGHVIIQVLIGQWTAPLMLRLRLWLDSPITSVYIVRRSF